MILDSFSKRTKTSYKYSQQVRAVESD